MSKSLDIKANSKVATTGLSGDENAIPLSSPIFEVVSGQILLCRRQEFFRLHRDILLPMVNNVGIRPILMLFTEIGRYGRFLDVYQYSSFADYQTRTDQLLATPGIEAYYAEVGTCIEGSILVEIAVEFPHARQTPQGS